MMHRQVLVAAAAAVAVAVALATPHRAIGAQATSSAGYGYTITVTGSANRATAPTAEGAGQGYVGHAVVLPSRGRLDITSGEVDSVFSKGDYLLFDSTDVIVVHPATKEFAPLRRDASSRALEALEAMGLHITLSDEKVTLDSLGPSDTVAGVPTLHYRLTVAFNLAMDAGVMQQRLGSENVTDYWVAQVPGLPTNPLLRSNGFAGAAMTGMFTSLSARVDSVSARMGRTVALRTKARTRVITGPGQELQTQQTSEVSDLRRRAVERARLVLPADYKPAVPGIAGAAIDGGEKWRLPPR